MPNKNILILRRWLQGFLFLLLLLAANANFKFTVDFIYQLLNHSQKKSMILLPNDLKAYYNKILKNNPNTILL